MPPILAAERGLANLRGRYTSQELRVVLNEHVGGVGQIRGDDRKFYLPLYGSTCQAIITYDRGEIVALDRGPAINQQQWESLRQAVQDSLIGGQEKVARDFAFARYRVRGWWRGAQSGVQILPPPPGTPSAPVEMADHPFILEVPIQGSDVVPLMVHRHQRDHRRLTILLNVLLKGGTTLQPPRPHHIWAIVSRDAAGSGHDVKWVQEFFFSEHLGQGVLDTFSTPTGAQLEELEAAAYYGTAGHDGGGLRVPRDLDESICLYLRLSPNQRARFDRAAFWLDAVDRQWSFSIASSFASLVIALEALSEERTAHQVGCKECAWTGTHDVPGATGRLRNFFRQFTGGLPEGMLERIPKMRASILHGGALMQLDGDRFFGWDPLEQDEMELMYELAGASKQALRNWLRDPLGA